MSGEITRVLGKHRMCLQRAFGSASYELLSGTTVSRRASSLDRSERERRGRLISGNTGEKFGPDAQVQGALVPLQERLSSNRLQRPLKLFCAVTMCEKSYYFF